MSFTHPRGSFDAKQFRIIVTKNNKNEQDKCRHII